MARAQPIWDTFHGVCSAGGTRDVLLIHSAGPGSLKSSDVVSQCEIKITEEDRRKLTNQGISPECSDDLSIVHARIGLDSTLELVRVLVNEEGQELSRGYILEQIKDFLASTKKPGGEILHVHR